MFDANSLEMRVAAGRNSVGCSMRECADRPAACSEGGFSVGMSEDRSCAMPADDAGPADLDYLYNMIDKLYHAYARGCGISDCAYWMLYDLVLAGGELPLSELTASWSYSKQTINSALKTLRDRGLVELSFMEGSRKSKRATLTEDGRVFSSRHIVPAIRAEDRAFSNLSAAEQEELVRLVRRYVDALDAQLAAVETGDDALERPAAGDVAPEDPVSDLAEAAPI